MEGKAQCYNLYLHVSVIDDALLPPSILLSIVSYTTTKPVCSQCPCGTYINSAQKVSKVKCSARRAIDVTLKISLKLHHSKIQMTT